MPQFPKGLAVDLSDIIDRPLASKWMFKVDLTVQRGLLGATTVDLGDFACYRWKPIAEPIQRYKHDMSIGYVSPWNCQMTTHLCRYDPEEILFSFDKIF